MKFLLKIVTMALAIFLIAKVMAGVEVTDLSMALLVALLLVLINTYVKPVLIFLTFPITVVTLGLFLLVINAGIILLTSFLLKDGFKVDGFWVALLFSLVLSMLTALIDRIIDGRKAGETPE